MTKTVSSDACHAWYYGVCVTKTNDSWCQSCGESRKKKLKLLQGHAGLLCDLQVEISLGWRSCPGALSTNVTLIQAYFKKLFWHNNSKDWRWLITWKQSLNCDWNISGQVERRREKPVKGRLLLNVLVSSQSKVVFSPSVLAMPGPSECLLEMVEAGIGAGEQGASALEFPRFLVIIKDVFPNSLL